MNSSDICVFGEVLFDHFPDGSQVLGGAPFNVAWHLQAFRQSPLFISRIGDDNEGHAIRKAMRDWQMDTSFLQTDTSQATGLVKVEFSEGEPAYEIVDRVAYDAIDRELVPEHCKLLYHGSLALRHTETKNAALTLRQSKPELIFVDVNLRTPWWNQSGVVSLVTGADWVKLNTEEMQLLFPEISEPTSLIQEMNLDGLILTHGSDGAEILTRQGEHALVKPEFTTHVVDTVGAGDAFASVMILGLNSDWPITLTAQRAQAFASGIVTQRGATVNDSAFYADYLKDWDLS